MPLKVLMFGWEFLPHNSGGLGTACFGLSRAMAQAGAGVTFVLPKRMPVDSPYVRIRFASDGSLKIRNVDVHLYPYITSTKYAEEREFFGGVNPYGLSLMAEVARYARKAKTIALEESFDVIHAHDWLSVPAGLAAKRATGKPLIIHVHATEFDRTGGNGVNQDVYNIERKGAHEADRVITVSHRTKEMLVKHYGVPAEKISVVHNGVLEEEFRPVPRTLEALREAGNKIVLFVGRITLQKGPDYFVRAAKKVLELRPQTIFVVSGSGDMERQMMREAADQGIADKVIFAGFLRGEELKSIYASADLYVMPSVSEPFGITPLESLANGTPVLISKQSGVSEALTHALKADFWDIDDMTDKIISVLDHSSLQENLRENGRREAGKLTWAEAARKCLEIYQQVFAFQRV